MLLGDPFSLTIYGTPGVSGLLGVDTSGGPVQTSIGTVCLGITSNLQLIPFTLDGVEMNSEDAAPIRLQGTFEIPCRGGMMEGACTPSRD